MNNKIADTVLLQLAMKFPNETTLGVLKLIIKDENESEDDLTFTLNELILEGWIMMITPDCYMMTAKGKQLHAKYNSYSLFEQSNKKQKRSQAEIDRLTVKKLRYDVRISKWQSWLFLPTSILGILGGLCGVVSLMINAWPEEQKRASKEIIQPVVKQDSVKAQTVKQAVFKPTDKDI